MKLATMVQTFLIEIMAVRNKNRFIVILVQGLGWFEFLDMKPLHIA